MTRPAERPLRKLPTLETRRAELETCAFCPKLCRAACPVSNAEPRETLIPWGKMTGAYALALGDLEASAESAAPTWACTGCLACREACDHRNPVATTLIEARDALAREGLAPPGAARVIARHKKRRPAPSVAATGAIALLEGCLYAERLPETAQATRSVATAAMGKNLRALEACCGLPLALAGDREGFARSVGELADALAPAAHLVVADAGCAYALIRLTEELGIDALDRKAIVVEPLVDLVAKRLDRFERGGAALPGGAPAYHDPCLLGRGLGRFEAPRRILAHVLGENPREFLHSHETAHCSGAGGLLPVTMPAVSAAITQARVSPPEAPEGAAIVTACASSLLAFRRAGKVAYDMSDLVARAAQATGVRGKALR